MDRRLALTALWAAFAAASVGVGFGAAGLVGDPFSDGVTDAAPATRSGPEASSTSPPHAGTNEPASSAGPTGTGSSTPTGQASPRTSTTAPGAPEGPGPAPDQAVTRNIITGEGTVWATCRSGLVQLSASPAVGWQIEDIDEGRQRDARVRFEPAGDGDGRVEVEAVCAQGTPQFALDDDRDSGGGHGGSDDD